MAEDEGRVKLKKEIGLFSGVMIVVGTIIGSGIFVSPKGVFEHAGSVGASLVIWVLCGLFSMIGAVCYAELGTSIPRSGGDYAYVLEAFGPLSAFLRLWVTVLVVQPATLAVLSLTFATYMVKPLYPDCEPPDLALRLMAIVCLCLLTYVNCKSVKLAMKVQDVFTTAKLAALALIIVTGIVRIAQGEVGYLQNSFEGEYSVGGISLSFYAGLFAFGGWNYLNYVSEELKDPNRNLPRAIYIGITLVTVVYVLANVAYFTAVSPQEMLASPAVAVTFAQRTIGVVAWIMPVCVSLSTFGGLNGIMFTIARLFFIGALEGHLPMIFGMINTPKLTPTPPLLLSCAVALLMFVTSDIFVLINYLSFNQWLWVGVSILGMLWLRYKRPNMHRPIKVPLIFPVVFLAMCTFLTFMPLYASPTETGMGLVILVTGIPAYYIFVIWSPKNKVIRKFSEFMTIEMQKYLEVILPEQEEKLLEVES
ncbi:LOW QUALITY PROTEIN: large neutral amino acids transporter small subunit 2-like [Dermacentor silvarum]|uniref:LOW QUALITY PROTEIN: large neutral amino acids transporter small subunit 2-like n=1 Tax=Dermacentor silvarum TaxID=543639 RepID=UPI002100A910|nr:LOW QUALITY PROTEIN: large neutral amino acids transporter small subunit 2-like [Dermacentor silvarum]